jgi:predicted transcriptional regulator
MPKDVSLDRTFHALADPTRRSILQLVSTGPASISELAPPFGIALPTVLEQVRILEETRLLTTTMRRAVMAKVTSEISMSLDGFITGSNVGVGNGMGDDGDRLHDWRFDAKTETDAAIVDEIYRSTGAVLIGRRMFDVGFEPWAERPSSGST